MPPVHLSYEQRNAVEIAAVRAEPKAAGKKGKGKKTVPKVTHIPATPENSPIAAGLVTVKPKKPKTEKVDKVLLAKLIESERVNSRITPTALKRKPGDLSRSDENSNREFALLWGHAVDLALDAEFKRTRDQGSSLRYGARYERFCRELAKPSIYKETPEDVREAKILNMHRLFWCYKKVELIIPQAPVDTSQCWIVFSQPHDGQKIYTQPEVRVPFWHRNLEGILFAYKGIQPWEFAKSRATFMVKRIRQGHNISAEKVEERLKNWNSNGVLRMMEWQNSQTMAGWNF